LDWGCEEKDREKKKGGEGGRLLRKCRREKNCGRCFSYQVTPSERPTEREGPEGETEEALRIGVKGNNSKKGGNRGIVVQAQKKKGALLKRGEGDRSTMDQSEGREAARSKH